jgi:hypothetical protein
VSERLKELASKASVGETQPWVQIPPSPPFPFDAILSASSGESQYESLPRYESLMRLRFQSCASILRAIWFRALLGFMLATVMAASRSSWPAPHRWEIITWGPNTSEWNVNLHVTGMRRGCSDSPASCMKMAGSASSDGMKIFLAVPLKEETVGYGAEYAKLSRDNHEVVEIGVDDFTGQYERLLAIDASHAPAVLNSMIDGVKSGDSKLKFGATIYEDELPLAAIGDPNLPAAIRAKFDFVHLYLHFRSNGANMPAYVSQARELFPSAQIVLGVYAYDRISYIPCAKGSSRPCTIREEKDYLRQALDADFELLKSGTVSGLEFYPGSFGLEDDWSGWNKPNICPGRRQECVDNTKALRQMVLEKFRNEL